MRLLETYQVWIEMLHIERAAARIEEAEQNDNWYWEFSH